MNTFIHYLTLPFVAFVEGNILIWRLWFVLVPWDNFRKGHGYTNGKISLKWFQVGWLQASYYTNNHILIKKAPRFAMAMKWKRVIYDR